MSPVPAFLLDLLLLAALAFLGFCLASLVVDTRGRMWRLGLAFPLGGGIVTWVVFLLSWAGVRVATATIVALLLSLLVIAGVLAYRKRSAEAHSRAADISGGQTPIEWAREHWPLAGIVALSLLGVIIAIGRSYSTWDAIAIWSIKGYGIVLKGSVLAGDDWGAHRLYYPLNVPLLIALFRALSGDVLPGSKAIFPLFYLSTAVVAFAYWRKNGLSTLQAGLGMLFVGTVPVVYYHSTIGYANLPLACYLVLGILLGCDGIFSSNRRTQLLSGILLGLAAWTRVEGILYCLAAMAALVVASWIGRRGRISYASWVLPLIAIVGPWIVFYLRYGAAASPATGAMTKASQGIASLQFNPAGLTTVMTYVKRLPVDTATWGALFLVGALLLIAGRRNLPPNVEPRNLALGLAFVAILTATCLVYYVGSFNTDDLAGWLQRSFPREFLQGALLFGIWAIAANGSAQVARSASDAVESP